MCHTLTNEHQTMCKKSQQYKLENKKNKDEFYLILEEPVLNLILKSDITATSCQANSKTGQIKTQKTNKHYHSAGKLREQIWIKTLANAKVEYRNLHQTRGTFISTLISNGEDITYVSKIAGHENVKVTLEKYSEYIPVQNKNFGNCFKKV